jgi:hypothetical protein
VNSLAESVGKLLLRGFGSFRQTLDVRLSTPLEADRELLQFFIAALLASTNFIFKAACTGRCLEMVCSRSMNLHHFLS